MTPKKSWTIIGTLLADLFFLWVIVEYAMGGWQLGLYLLTHNGIIPWLILLGVLFLLLYRSDYRTDVPIFVAAMALGYWGEWWGTTRGLWTYWNGQTPPAYLPPLWGIGLLTVYRLHLILIGLSKTAIPTSKGVRKKNKPNRSRWIVKSGGYGLDVREPQSNDLAIQAERSGPFYLFHVPKWLKVASFVALPGLAFAKSWPLLAQVDWAAALDAHFYAGLLIAGGLILFRFDLNETFWLYLCGTVLGGTYEYLGTSWGEWRYVTGEVPPLWIAPLWGLASVAMVKLGLIVRKLGALIDPSSRLWYNVSN
jgi:hypothetical protein